MFYEQGYSSSEGKFKYRVSSADISVQELLAGIPIQQEGGSANYLSDLGYTADDTNIKAVLYQYVDEAVEDAYDAVQEKVQALAKRYGMVFELGLESGAEDKLLEIAVPELGETAVELQPEQFLKGLLELDLIAGAWLVDLSVTEDTLSEHVPEEPDSEA